MGPDKDMRRWRSSTTVESRGTHKLRAQAGGGEVRKEAVRERSMMKHTESKSSPESPVSRLQTKKTPNAKLRMPTSRRSDHMRPVAA
ncbi:hypothetical protein ON010_g7989 [Phytophthora cinnamomi]|nr:hypothetical protein ON010_g7989 [Phytophthora cinnamomi]